MANARTELLIGFMLCMISVVAGMLLSRFWLHVATETLIMMPFAMSFSLLYGHTGLLSFGQAAYFGLGAYGFSLALARFHLPFPLCFLIGIVVATMWAFITGYICVRLAGIYFAIMTVVVAQSTFYILFQWYGFTGGDDGIQGLLPPPFLADPRAYYYFTLAFVAAAFLGYCRIVTSPFGLSLRCIRENMVRNEFVGIDVQRQRLKAFVFAGFLAGLAGVLYAPFTRTVVPQMANWLSSGNAVFMGILGGASHLFGPLVGALIWVFLDAFVSGFTEHWPVIIGCILFVIVLFMPGGIAGIIYTVKAKRQRLQEH